MQRKITKFPCPNCQREREFLLGPAKEHAMCGRCGTLIDLPQPEGSSKTRRGVLKVIGTLTTAVIANLLSPKWRIWDLVQSPKRVEPTPTVAAVKPLPATSIGIFWGTP